MAGIIFDFSATGRQPTETMVAIFQLVDREDAQRCCWVSRRWRALVLQADHCFFNCIHEVHLDEDIDLPLVIRQLKCTRHEGTARDIILVLTSLSDRSPLPDLFKALASTMGSVDYLELIADQADWTAIQDCLASSAAPLLTCLSLSVDRGDPPTGPPVLTTELFHGACPKLVDIYLRNITLPIDARFPMPTIATVRFMSDSPLALFPMGLISLFPNISNLHTEFTLLRANFLALSPSKQSALQDFVTHLSQLHTSPTILEALLNATPVTAAIQHITIANPASGPVVPEMVSHLAKQAARISLTIKADIEAGGTYAEFRAGSITRAYTISNDRTAAWHSIMTPVLPSTQAFLRLTTLSIAANYFALAWHMLPLGPSLQHLELHCDLSLLDPLIRTLPQASRPRQLIGLRDVRIVARHLSALSMGQIKFAAVSTFLISMVGQEAAVALTVTFQGFVSVIHGDSDPHQLIVPTWTLVGGQWEHLLEPCPLRVSHG